jgi:hypothetical protein
MPLSIGLYQLLALSFVQDSVHHGHCDGPFAHLFFLLMWNLMCRASNCDDVLWQHVEWRGDALVIYFARSKTDQGGDKAKYPRHIYANPPQPQLCPILSLGIYMASYGVDVVQENRLFPGRNQYDRCVRELDARTHKF